MGQGHAKLAPSASSRWMTCPGSIAMCDQVPDSGSSIYAREGTLAHLVGEECLNSPSRIDAHIIKSVADPDAFKRIPVPDDMYVAVQEYVDYCRAVKAFDDFATIEIERKFNLVWLDKDIWGTSDCIIWLPQYLTLYVIDYKHGAGVAVDVVGNTQLMIYGLGSLECIPPNVDFGRVKVVMTIVQPRADHSDGTIRSYTLTATQLLQWGRDYLKPLAARTKIRDAPLCEGTYCRWCDALAVCPQMINRALALAKIDFNNPIFPNPASLSPQDILKIIELSQSINGWVSSIKDYAQRQAHCGVKFPGLKLVATKSNRKWTNEEMAVKYLQQYLQDDKIFTRKITSPAQAEAQLKIMNVSKDGLRDYWTKPDAGLSLVHESDKRKEVLRISAAEDFAEPMPDFLM